MWITRKRYNELKEIQAVNTALKSTINSLEDENKNLKFSIRERDKMIEEELNKNIKHEEREIDLENNIEFLFNNLSKAKQNRINKLSTKSR
jgi:hypothetical protein